MAMSASGEGARRVSGRELAAVTLVLLLAIFLLTPRGWEPGGETWRYWAAARILRETGGFPVFSVGPLYVLYLQAFSGFGYPLGVQLEYVVTHLLCYCSVWLMLRGVLPATVALVLTCAWLPMMATLQGAGALAGLGWLAWYCRGRVRSGLNHGWVPPSLTAAALCHSAYAPFLGGHVVGMLMQRWRRIPAVSAPIATWARPWRHGLIALLATVALLTVVAPSRRWDHNHMLMDPTYSPIPLRDPVTIGFFQTGNFRHVMRTVPEPLRLEQDWYLTNKAAFGGATTILEAVRRRPAAVLRNVAENIGTALRLPLYFLVGWTVPDRLWWTVAVVAWLLVPVAWLGLSQQFGNRGERPWSFALGCGTIGVVASLWLVWFTPRYLMTLLPVGLLMVAGLGQGAVCLAAGVRRTLAQSGRSRGAAPAAMSKRIVGLGILCLAAGLVLNEWVLIRLFSPDGILARTNRIQIWLLELFLISFGGLLVAFRAQLARGLAGTSSLTMGRGPGSSGWRAASALALASAACVLATVDYPLGNAAQFRAVAQGRSPLPGAQLAGLNAAHRELLAMIHRGTRVLALEDCWVKAFTSAELDRVVNVLALPPFPDQTGAVVRTLERLDVIWVSPDWSTPAPSVGTQTFLRYRLHVAPFLERALASGWVVREIGGSRIYRRSVTL